MSERRYSLFDLTGAMGEALKRLPPGTLASHERLLFLYTDHVVALLKALPVVEAPRLPQKSDL